MTGDLPRGLEMGSLVARVRAFLSARGGPTGRADGLGLAPGAFAARTGFARGGPRSAEIVLAGQAALELGHPKTASVAAALTTCEAGLVAGGRVSRLGPDLSSLPAGGRAPFAQLVLLRLEPGVAVDPVRLETTGHLVRRLPGLMARSVPGRLWIRVARAALAAGLGLETLGEALIVAHREDLDGVLDAEVLFVTSSEEDVRALEPVALAAAVVLGRSARLSLDPSGELGCAQGTCEGCADRAVCDAARAILEERRRGAA